jgi:hypothetical protein
VHPAIEAVAAAPIIRQANIMALNRASMSLPPLGGQDHHQPKWGAEQGAFRGAELVSLPEAPTRYRGS